MYYQPDTESNPQEADKVDKLANALIVRKNTISPFKSVFQAMVPAADSVWPRGLGSR